MTRMFELRDCFIRSVRRIPPRTKKEEPTVWKKQWPFPERKNTSGMYIRIWERVENLCTVGYII